MNEDDETVNDLVKLFKRNMKTKDLADFDSSALRIANLEMIVISLLERVALLERLLEKRI